MYSPASLSERGGTASAVTEGVAYCTGDTPPGICLKSANASPLIEGAGNGANNNLKQTDKSEFEREQVWNLRFWL